MVNHLPCSSISILTAVISFGIGLFLIRNKVYHCCLLDNEFYSFFFALLVLHRVYLTIQSVYFYKKYLISVTNKRRRIYREIGSRNCDRKLDIKIKIKNLLNRNKTISLNSCLSRCNSNGIGLDWIRSDGWMEGNKLVHKSNFQCLDISLVLLSLNSFILSIGFCFDCLKLKQMLNMTDMLVVSRIYMGNEFWWVFSFHRFKLKFKKESIDNSKAKLRFTTIVTLTHAVTRETSEKSISLAETLFNKLTSYLFGFFFVGQTRKFWLSIFTFAAISFISLWLECCTQSCPFSLLGKKRRWLPYLIRYHQSRNNRALFTSV